MKKSNNLILQYHQTIKESIDAGLFATVYEASDINTLMEVPYNLQPTTNFQKSNFETRAKIFPIGPFLQILRIVLVMKCLFFMCILLLKNQD